MNPNCIHITIEIAFEISLLPLDWKVYALYQIEWILSKSNLYLSFLEIQGGKIIEIIYFDIVSGNTIKSDIITYSFGSIISAQ